MNNKEASELVNKKPQLGLVPLWALEGVADVLNYGNTKYGRMNFMQSSANELTANTYMSAALRHLASMQGRAGNWLGVDALDAESGYKHIDHAIANLLILKMLSPEDIPF